MRRGPNMDEYESLAEAVQETLDGLWDPDRCSLSAPVFRTASSASGQVLVQKRRNCLVAGFHQFVDSIGHALCGLAELLDSPVGCVSLGDVVITGVVD